MSSVASFLPRLLSSLLLCAMGALTGAQAQEYPSKPIRIVVPYPPASGTDVLARAIAQRLSEEVGQPVIIDNKGGANGAIGMESVARAAPDGYTILFTPGSPVLTTPYLYHLNFDALKELEPVALLANGTFAMVGNPSVPYQTLAQLIDYARKNPGKMTCASAGAGSQAHINFEMVRHEAGFECVHVPYKGGGPALVDVLGGQVQLFFDSLPVMLPHIRAGRLKVFAVTSSTRSPFLPDTPSLSESLKGVDTALANPWYAVFAPAGTPPALVQRLNTILHKVAQSPELVRQLPDGGFVPAPTTTPAEFRAFYRAKYEAAGKTIQSLGIKAD
jgi:tripartite-type tricarboxylate transporter receptor subunit TctC